MKKLVAVMCALFIFFVVADMQARKSGTVYGAPSHELTYADSLATMIARGSL